MKNAFQFAKQSRQNTQLGRGQKKVWLGALVTTVLGLTACSSLTVGDGSLDYQQAQLLPPVQLPVEQQTAPFVPLYPVPQAVSKNTLTLKNSKGNRFELPKPLLTVSAQPNQPSTVARTTSTPVSQKVIKDVNLVSEAGNPVLKITGQTDKVANQVLAATQTAGYRLEKTATDSTALSLAGNGLIQPLLLNIVQADALTSVSVQQADGQLVDADVSKQVLVNIAKPLLGLY